MIKTTLSLKERVEELEAQIEEFKELFRSKETNNNGQELTNIFPGSSIQVDNRKLVYCQSPTYSLYVQRILCLVFSVRELYRTSVRGGSSKEKKRQLDSDKLLEIYELVKIKFPNFYETNFKKFKTLINSEINSKLGSLNRYFKQIKENMELESDEQIKKYTLTKDDKFLLRDLNEFEDRPSLFLDLDKEIELNSFKHIEEYINENIDF